MNWNKISSDKILSESFMRINKNDLNWYLLCLYQTMSDTFIQEHRKYILNLDWYGFSRREELTEEVIRRFHNYVNWLMICRKQIISESLIREFQRYLDEDCWEYISMNQTLSEPFIREFYEYLDLRWVLRCQTVSETFIIENADDILEDYREQSIDTGSQTTIICHYVYWSDISRKRDVSELMIRTFQIILSKEDWKNVSKTCVLSESFIREFADMLDWENISEFQKLRMEFVEEFKDKLNLQKIKTHNAKRICKYVAKKYFNRKVKLVKQLDLPSHCNILIASYLG